MVLMLLMFLTILESLKDIQRFLSDRYLRVLKLGIIEIIDGTLWIFSQTSGIVTVTLRIITRKIVAGTLIMQGPRYAAKCSTNAGGGGGARKSYC